MRKAYILVTAASLVLASMGCQDDVSGPERQNIIFSVDVEENDSLTKALLEPADLLTTGTEVMVYGFASNGDIPGHTSSGAGSTKLNQGQIISYSGDRIWSYASGEAYQWKDADHRFFGWLVDDNKSGIDAASFFGSGFSFNGSTLTVPAKKMGINKDNLDFAYSDITLRTASSADYSAVGLTLKHLFASFSLGARNYTKNSLSIDHVYLHGLKDNKSAAINYSGTSVSTTYSGGTTMTAVDLLNGNTVTLAKSDTEGDRKANIIGTVSNTATYFLVWPQTEGEMTADGAETDGVWIPADSAQPYLEIVYHEGSDAPITVDVPIPHECDTNASNDDGYGLGWAPGVRHQMELSFSEKKICLTFKAAGWDKQETVIDIGGSVAVPHKLQLASDFIGNCVLSSTGDTAFFKAGIPIILEFGIDQPKNASWIVSKNGDWDSFDVCNYPDGVRKDPDEILTAEGMIVPGTLSKIAIYPPTTNLNKKEYVLTLSFSVRFNNGDITDINGQIYDDDSPKTFVFIK